MCLKVNASFDKQPAVAVRVENVPGLDWSNYEEMRKTLLRRKDLATFRQSREFRVSDNLVSGLEK